MQTEKVIDHIVTWLKNYATNAKQKGFVIGISGGIDSAVTSLKCQFIKRPISPTEHRDILRGYRKIFRT